MIWGIQKNPTKFVGYSFHAKKSTTYFSCSCSTRLLLYLLYAVGILFYHIPHFRLLPFPVKSHEDHIEIKSDYQLLK